MERSNLFDMRISMTTQDQPNDQAGVAPERNGETKSPLNLGAALLSFILPGFGQLTQMRSGAFVGHLSLYALAAAIPFTVLYFFWEGLPPRWRGDIAPVFLLLPLPFLMVLFSALDAAYWKRGEPSRMRRPVRRLGIAIVCICGGLVILLPMISAAREAARRMQCANNLKQLALCMHNYYSNYGEYPPAYTVDASGKPLHSWRVLLLPYMYQQKLYDEIRLDEPWDSDHNRQFHSRMPSMYRCPSEKDGGLLRYLIDRYPNMERGNLNCSYSIVVGDQTVFPGPKSTKNGDITDGTSNTILIVERLVPACWMAPTHEITFEDASLGVNASLNGPGSAHAGGCMAVMADGAEQYFSETISPELFKATLTRAGGETAFDFLK